METETSPNPVNIEPEKSALEAKIPANIEERRALAKVLLAQDQPLEAIMAQSGLSKQAVFGLKGSLVKADQRLERSSSMEDNHDSQTEAKSKPRIEIQTKNQASPVLDGADGFGDEVENARSPLALSPNNVPSIPEGYIIKAGLTGAEWKEINALDKNKLVALVAELKATNSSLQAGAHMQPKGNGDGHDSSLSFYDEESQKLDLELKRIRNRQEIEYEQALRDDRFRTRMASHVKNEAPVQSFGFKDVVEIAKIFTSSKGDAGLKEVLSVAEYLSSKNNSGQSAPTNQIDLQLEEMKQSHEIDLKRLGWEQTKWQEEKADSAGKWDVVKSLIEGPAGSLIAGFGKIAQDKLSGKAKNVQPVQIPCPACSKPIFVDPNANIVICPSCGVSLQKPESQPSQKMVEEPQITEPTKPDLTTIEKTELKTPTKTNLFSEGEF